MRQEDGAGRFNLKEFRTVRRERSTNGSKGREQASRALDEKEEYDEENLTYF